MNDAAPPVDATGAGVQPADAAGPVPTITDGPAAAPDAVATGLTTVTAAVTAAAPTRDPAAPAAPAGPVLLRIVRGDADDDDVAAVVAALTALAPTPAGVAARMSPAAAGRSRVDPWTVRLRGRPATSAVTARWG